jgi:hypothetical protein
MKTKTMSFMYATMVVIILLISSSASASITIPTKTHSFNQETPYSSEDISVSKIQTAMNMVNEQLLLGYMNDLVGLAPRYTGTYGCEQTALYIHDQFDSNGLGVRYQNWTGQGNRWNRGTFSSQNVEGTQPGTETDRIIIFNAHYDTVKNVPGADDDGSGTAAVLAAAYILSQFNFKHALKFVTFSGEEIGLLGSHAYAKEAYDNNDNIFVELNADMIAYTETPAGGSQYRIYGTPDIEWMLDAIDTINTDYGCSFNISRRILDEEASRGGSDYFSFEEYGYETLVFFESEFNPYMHTPDDTIEHMNMSYFVNTTRLIVGTMAYLADLDIPTPQASIEFPKRGVLYKNEMPKKTIADLKTVVVNDIWIWANVQPGNTSIDRAEFYYDDILMYVDMEAPYKWHCDQLSLRTHKITVVVYDHLGRQSTAWQNIWLINLKKNT